MAFVVFLLAALLGAFVQTVTGFALGMVLIALAAGLQLVSIPVLTATVSILSLVNVSIALRRDYKKVHVGFWGLVTLGQIPAIGVGFALMRVLSDDATVVLQLLLGMFVLGGSLSMMRENAVIARVSPKPVRVIAGVAGGLCGGMFSASGPVMGWFLYRQPLPVEVIRPTLLACFGLTTSVRTIIVGATDGFNQEILELAAASIPMVALGTWLGGKYVGRIEPDTLRRVAFGLLTVMGALIVLRSSWLLATN